MVSVPVIRCVDVLVVGGSSGGVACALAAARGGASVFLAAPRPYLGDDVCAHWRLWPGISPGDCGLAKRVFGQERPTPLHVKLVLEQALVGRGVPFLFGCHPAGVLRDRAGRIAGAVLASRAGLLAVRAGAVVDASWRGLVARQAGIPFLDWPGGELTGEWVLVGHDLGAVAGAGDEVLPATGCRVPQGPSTEVEIRRYRLAATVPTAGWSDLARAETEARLRTWQAGQRAASEALFGLPPDPVAPGPRHLDDPSGTGNPDPAVLAADEGLHLLGPCADLDRRAAAALVEPPRLMHTGEALGATLAAERRPAPGGALDYAIAGAAKLDCQARVLSGGPRGLGHAGERIDVDLSALPVVGDYAVVVGGGGTAGAPAGIAAARAGARTLVIEYQAALGGVGTVGQITNYYHGNRGGFTAACDAGVLAMGATDDASVDGSRWHGEWKQAWYLRELVDAGGEAWFGCATVGALADRGRVRGVLAAGPWGFGAVRAQAVVDASGAADLAAAAGATCVHPGERDLAVQGTGLSPRSPGVRYQNSDHCFSDDGDLVDTTNVLVASKLKFRGWFDCAQLVDSRERRQIVGDVVLDPVDFLAGRTWPDAICLARSNFDSHGFTVHPLFAVEPPDKEGLEAYVPYRCLLPAGLDGVLVTGLAVSCQRDALPVIRMQPDVQNQGYAAGRAAAMAAAADGSTRGVDLAALQAHLVEVGILDPDVPGQADNFPLPAAAIRAAVGDGGFHHREIAMLLSRPADARSPLREALVATEEPARRTRLAKLLGLMGDAAGSAVLAEAVVARGWDAGWNFVGMGQFGMSLSETDGLLLALATCDPAAAARLVPPLAAALDGEPELSHCRALALAAGWIGADPEVAAALAGLLARPGLRGHACPDTVAYQARLGDAINETAERNRSLRELFLAQGLFLTGDDAGLARGILEAYAEDVRGAYARHARKLLAEG